MSTNEQCELVRRITPSVLCHANVCGWNDKNGSCCTEYVEVDDHGICIMFAKRDSSDAPSSKEQLAFIEAGRSSREQQR